MSPPVSGQITSALMWACLAVLAYLMYLVVQPFLSPLGWACVIAVLAYPMHARLARRIGSGPAAAVTTLGSAALLLVPTLALTNAFAREMVGIAQSLQAGLADGQASSLDEWWQRAVRALPLLERIDLGTVGPNAFRDAAAFLMGQSGAILANVAAFFVDLALSLFATFFLLRDADAIMRAVRRLLPMTPAARETFIRRTGELVFAGVTSSVIVAGLQGLMGGLLFALLGLAAPVFWGVVMALACLLPFGAGIVWLPAGIYLMATGSVTKGIVMIALGAGIVSMVDNVVRPLLLSGRVQMNGLVIFVSLLGGLNVFGLLGIVLGPIVVVTAISLVTSYIDTVPDADAGTPADPAAPSPMPGDSQSAG